MTTLPQPACRTSVGKLAPCPRPGAHPASPRLRSRRHSSGHCVRNLHRSICSAAATQQGVGWFERWVRRLEMKDVVSFMDVNLRGGLFKGRRLMSFFQQRFADRPIGKLVLPFAAVATALHERTSGYVAARRSTPSVRRSPCRAVHAVLHDGMVLVDGGLVIPYPFRWCRCDGRRPGDCSRSRYGPGGPLPASEPG